MANYSNDIKQAQAAIKEAGKAVIWRKLARTPDNSQPWKGTTAPTDFPNTYIMYMGKASLTAGFFHFMKDTDVTEGAPDAIMAGGLPFIPELTDAIIDGADTWIIADIDSLAPDGTNILYYLRFE